MLRHIRQFAGYGRGSHEVLAGAEATTSQNDTLPGSPQIAEVSPQSAGPALSAKGMSM